jgi:hypothetical protein
MLGCGAVTEETFFDRKTDPLPNAGSDADFSFEINREIRDPAWANRPMFGNTIGKSEFATPNHFAIVAENSATEVVGIGDCLRHDVIQCFTRVTLC